MPDNEHRDLERDKSQELLDELRGIREGLHRLAASVEDVSEILSEATGIELVDDEGDGEDVEPVPETESGLGEALGAFGRIIINGMKSRRRRGPE